MSAGRLSLDALFRQFDRERSGGWSYKNFMDALRAADMVLAEGEGHTMFAMLAHGGGDSTRITARTFHEKMHAAKSLRLGEHVRRREMAQLPHVDRSRRKRIFDRADAEGNGWLDEDQVTQALAEIYPDFSHAESALLAFEAAWTGGKDGHGTRRIQLREFGLLIEYVRYFNANWSAFEEIGRRSALTLAQFKAACRDVLPQEISTREVEHEFDQTLAADDDDKVPFQEFCKWAAMRAVPGNDYASPVRTHPCAASAALLARPLTCCMAASGTAARRGSRSRATPSGASSARESENAD
jgi:hypothetical protein